MAFVSHNAGTPDAPVRSIATFDFGDHDHDVWNGFAIAIAVILARNYLVGLRRFDDGSKGGVVGTQRSDPDA